MTVFINELLTLLGGIGVIVLALFGGFMQIQLTRYKSALTETRDKLNKVLESEVHAKKTIFDKEFNIYEELWDLVTELEHETHKLLHQFEVSKELVDGTTNQPEAKLEFVNRFNNTFYRVKKFSPFIPSPLSQKIETNLAMFKLTVQAIEVNGNEAKHLPLLESSVLQLRNLIEARIKEYMANV